jgi:hypothetical protein
MTLPRHTPRTCDRDHGSVIPGWRNAEIWPESGPVIHQSNWRASADAAARVGEPERRRLSTTGRDDEAAGDLIARRARAPGPPVRPGTLASSDDDGETFDYEGGELTWTRLTVARHANGALRGKRNLS